MLAISSRASFRSSGGRASALSSITLTATPPLGTQSPIPGTFHQVDSPLSFGQRIEQLVLAGAAGISGSGSDANKLTDAINRAVDRGVPVATFDSDAPASKRFVTYGIDDILCGAQTMDELAKLMNGRGVVAILAGNQNAPNLQRRVQGAKEAAKKYPGITVRDTYYHKETPQDAAAKVEQVMQANPDITGWAMIGGWPLFTENALKWRPGTVKCVSIDALPAQLAYIRSGHVPVLLAQQCYEWGHRTVELLVEGPASRVTETAGDARHVWCPIAPSAEGRFVIDTGDGHAFTHLASAHHEHSPTGKATEVLGGHFDSSVADRRGVLADAITRGDGAGDEGLAALDGGR